MNNWDVAYTAGRGIRKCVIKLPVGVKPTFSIMDAALKRAFPKAEEIEALRWSSMSR